jgi:hypothetical protein
MMNWQQQFADHFIAKLTTQKPQPIEIKMHTTIYWEVPEGRDPEEYMQELSEMPKLDALAKATDFGDSELEVN